MKKKEEKSKKGLICLIVLITLLIILLILWLFLKLDVIFKYNNGDEDFVSKVRILTKVNKEDIRYDLVKPGSSFLGYFETYLLKDGLTECKKGFKLHDKTKCVSEAEFDFEHTRIMKNKTIEAMWSAISFSINPTSKTINEGASFVITTSISGTNDKTVVFSSDNSSIAKVDNNGKVTGVKAGKEKITATSNGIKRTCVVTVVKPDNSKISLSTSKKCIIGTNSVTLTAKVSGTKASDIKWTFPDCYKWNDKSDTVKTLARVTSKNKCDDNVALSPKVITKLPTGKTASVTLKYEPALEVKVYNNGSQITPDNGYYFGSYIKITTNVNATFSSSKILKSDSKSAQLKSAAEGDVVIKTSCGQTKTIKIKPIIN